MSQPTIRWDLNKVSGGWQVLCEMLMPNKETYSLGTFVLHLEDAQILMSHFPSQPSSLTTETTMLEEWQALVGTGSKGIQSTLKRRSFGGKPSTKQPSKKPSDSQSGTLF